MPEVNGKKFSYTKKGIANAKALAKKTGKKMKIKPIRKKKKPIKKKY